MRTISLLTCIVSLPLASIAYAQTPAAASPTPAYPPFAAGNTAPPVAPVQPPATAVPVQPPVAPAPVQPPVTPAPIQPAVTPAPVQPPAAPAPVQPSATTLPAQVPYGSPAQEQASQDRDVPSAIQPQGRPPPFYIPTVAEQALAPEPPPKPLMLNVLMDTHYFVSGSIRRFGDETRLRLGKDVGLTIGTFNFNALELGFDALRFGGIKVYEQPAKANLSVFVLLPNLDFRVFFSSISNPSRVGVALGTSLSGIRIASCGLTGCAEVSLRLVTLDGWYAGNSHGAGLARSVGGGISAGIKL